MKLSMMLEYHTLPCSTQKDAGLAGYGRWEVREGGSESKLIQPVRQTVRGRWSSTDSKSAATSWGNSRTGRGVLGRQVYSSIVLVQMWRKEGEAGLGAS